MKALSKQLFKVVMPETIISKPCSKCKVEKYFSEFYKQPAAKDGLQSACKACTTTAAVAWTAANLERTKANRAALDTATPNRWKASNAAYRSANRDKVRKSGVAYRTSNPDKVKARVAAWRKANPSKVKEAAAMWHKANPGRMKATQVAYRAANPEVRRITEQNRRARKLKAGGKLSKGLAKKLLKLQQGKCPCCKQPLGKDFHLDHIMPLFLGGPNTDDNIQLLRKICNLKKNTSHPVNWMQQQGFLL